MTIRTTTLSLLTLLTLFPTIAAANDEPPADGDTGWTTATKSFPNAWTNGPTASTTGLANPIQTTLPTPTCASCSIPNGTLTTVYRDAPRTGSSGNCRPLEKKVHVIFGDDSLDDELKHEANAYRNRTNTNGRIFDASQSRDNNASLCRTLV